MNNFKIKVGGYYITQDTPKEKVEALKKQYPQLSKVLKTKDGKEKTNN